MSFVTNRVSGTSTCGQSVNHMVMETGSYPPVISVLGIDTIIVEMPGGHTISLRVA